MRLLTARFPEIDGRHVTRLKNMAKEKRSIVLMFPTALDQVQRQIGEADGRLSTHT
jgi:hypothetical protein